jgi:hypothetical protein
MFTSSGLLISAVLLGVVAVTAISKGAFHPAEQYCPTALARSAAAKTSSSVANSRSTWQRLPSTAAAKGSQQQDDKQAAAPHALRFFQLAYSSSNRTELYQQMAVELTLHSAAQAVQDTLTQALADTAVRSGYTRAAIASVGPLAQSVLSELVSGVASAMLPRRLTTAGAGAAANSTCSPDEIPAALAELRRAAGTPAAPSVNTTCTLDEIPAALAATRLAALIPSAAAYSPAAAAEQCVPYQPLLLLSQQSTAGPSDTYSCPVCGCSTAGSSANGQWWSERAAVKLVAAEAAVRGVAAAVGETQLAQSIKVRLELQLLTEASFQFQMKLTDWNCLNMPLAGAASVL